mgnify:CR=1 FL=1
MRDQKGITLVALVITIIVLLILAGVSISLVLGQNGVLTQASNAVITNAKATALQELQMAAADINMEYTSKKSTGDTTVTKHGLVTVTRVQASCTNGTISFTPPTTDADKVTMTYTPKSDTSTSFQYEFDVATFTVKQK